MSRIDRVFQTRCLIAAIVLTTVPCGGQSAPAPAPADGQSPGSSISVVGTERLGWNQVDLPDAAQASGLRFTRVR